MYVDPSLNSVGKDAIIISWSNDRIGKSLTVTKHLWLCMYTFQTKIYTWSLTYIEQSLFSNIANHIFYQFICKYMCVHVCVILSLYIYVCACMCEYIYIYIYIYIWGGLVSLFNGISAFVGSWMSKPSLGKNSCGTI